MDDEIRIDNINGNVELENNNGQININREEGMPGKDATINGVNALTIEGGSNLAITQAGNIATLHVDLSSIEEDKTYVHVQLISSQSWHVQHNLGKYPSVTIIDSGGSVVFGDVEYVSLNEITVSFGFPFGGTAYLN